MQHGKPAPDLFLEAARRLGLDPSECIVFEDAVSGILAASAGGFSSVWIPDRKSNPSTEGTAEKCLLVLDSMEDFQPEAFLEYPN